MSTPDKDRSTPSGAALGASHATDAAAQMVAALNARRVAAVQFAEASVQLTRGSRSGLRSRRVRLVRRITDVAR